MAPALPRAPRLLRYAVGWLRSPLPPARASSSAAGMGTGAGTATAPGREAVIAATAAVAVAGSGLGLWLTPPSITDSGEAGGRQISVGGPGFVEEREEKGRFLLGDSFRRRVFFNYEKRIRLLSPPEKIFEYFAEPRRGSLHVAC